MNKGKKGVQPRAFAKEPEKLRKVYQAYLKLFPRIFDRNLPEKEIKKEIVLEEDYVGYIEHDLEVMFCIIKRLEGAIMYGHKRPHKFINLYLCSKAPSFGKTWLMKFLNAYLMTYRLPEDQYYVDYENNTYQVLVSDEADVFPKNKGV